VYTPLPHLPRRLCQALLIILALTLGGCALFTSHYDAGAYQNFTNLKAFHLKVLEDHTTQEGAVFNEDKLTAECDAGDLKFREANEYALGKGDNSRVKALSYLHNVFKDNCSLAKKQKKLFGKVFAAELTELLTRNYDLAISGELSRVGTPNTK